MFLRRARELLISLRFRVALSYFALVVVTSIVLFGILYYLLIGTLKEKDRRIIASDFKKFSILTNVSGADGLKDWFRRNGDSSQAKDVYVQLKSADGVSLFLHQPAGLEDFPRADFERASKAARDDQITRAESPLDSEDAVEFYSDTLPNGSKLQVGKDTDDREELLGRFREAFTLVIGFALLTALASSLFLSRTVLRPIQRLTRTVEEVRKGNLSARARVEESGDEINTLAKFLNGMLAQNSKLISALTESLDAVAHDLRTPLTRLRVHAERALPTNEEAFGAILENTDQVIELLNAILDVSEANAGTLAIRRSNMRLRPVLLEVIDVYSIIAEEKRINLIADSIDNVEFAADIRIKQAVANLIDNAIKFAPAGSSVRISARASSDEILIAVEDEGPGIAPGEEAKIWDRLYRSDHSRTTRGMGLGLSLVRAIVLAHGGRVSVTAAQSASPTGLCAGMRGSRFEIGFPRVLSSES